MNDGEEIRAGKHLLHLSDDSFGPSKSLEPLKDYSYSGFRKRFHGLAIRMFTFNPLRNFPNTSLFACSNVVSALQPAVSAALHLPAFSGARSVLTPPNAP